MAELQIVGGGKMGEALIGGLLSAGWATPAEVRVVEKVPARRNELEQLFPGIVVADSIGAAPDTLLATKPNDITSACATLAAAGPVRRVLSVAAGVTTAALEAALSAGGAPPPAVVRAMPNTPALVGAGAAAIAPGSTATADDLAWAASILRAVGVVEQVAESQLDAVTGLSGSGPAYVFLVAEALVEAGVLVGLSRQVAETLAHQTLLGAARLLVEGDRPAAMLRADVTSPGGTTAAGLRVLEQRAVRAALLDAVAAASARSAELGKS